MARLVFYTVILTWIQYASCLKILGVFPMASHSHFVIGFRLMKELADKGHEVTFINSYPQKTPIKNLKDVPVLGLKETLENHKVKLFNLEINSFFVTTFAECKLGNFITNVTYATAIQELMKTNATFDVILLEEFLGISLMGLSYYYNAPIILICPMGSTTWNNNLFGNPSPVSYIPNMYTSFSFRMNFIQRLQNFIYENFQLLYRHLIYYPKENEILHQYLPDAPHLSEIMHNASLMLLNSHSSYKDPAPLLPNMIEIGGYHISEPKRLPNELKKYLDDAKEGVVYFSMGSNLKSAYMPLGKRTAILKALSKLKQKVLWKFETEDIVDLPKNVKIQKWLPQQDVLAHPNVKVFVSHGGLLSTIEAVYHGVPILGIPIFCDQKMNMAIATEKGYAVNVPYRQLSEDILEKALTEILYNPKYTQNVKWRSRLLHDRPIKPLDTAVYWIEYVGKHGRSEHFRSAALDLNWYQIASFDIILLLVIITVILFLMICYVVKKILCCHKQIVIEKPKSE